MKNVQYSCRSRQNRRIVPFVLEKCCVLRLVATCLMLFSMISIVSPSAYAAQSTLVAETSANTIDPGSSFDVTVSIDQTSGIAGYLIYIYCDTDVFSAEIDENNNTCVVNKGTFTEKGTILANAYGTEGYQVLWFAPQNVSGSGSLFTITLTASEEAQGGSYQIGLGYSPENTIDVNAEPYAFTVQGVDIQISGEESDTEIDTNTQEDPDNNSNTSGSHLSVFPDVQKDNWAYPYIMALHERGIVSGSEDGMFNPDRNVTRAEFVKMLAGIAGADIRNCSTDQFSDVLPHDWFMPYVAWAHQSGIVNGMSETEFAPQALLTREQMATLVVRLCEKMEKTLNVKNAEMTFSDSESISSYAKKSVQKVQMAGIISGYPDGSFLPKANAKRSEAAKVLSSVLVIIEETSEKQA